MNLYRPFEPEGSSLASFSQFVKDCNRHRKLTEPVNSQTLDWLAGILAMEAKCEPIVARGHLIDAIPDGQEDVLHAGDHFILVADEAARMLGLDPFHIRYSPTALDS